MDKSKCCIWGCDEEATVYDDMDNHWCEDCAIQNIEEEPENWECINEE